MGADISKIPGIKNDLHMGVPARNGAQPVYSLIRGIVIDENLLILVLGMFGHNSLNPLHHQSDIFLFVEAG
jgi:hypothetical protein